LTDASISTFPHFFYSLLICAHLYLVWTMVDITPHSPHVASHYAIMSNELLIIFFSRDEPQCAIFNRTRDFSVAWPFHCQNNGADMAKHKDVSLSFIISGSLHTRVKKIWLMGLQTTIMYLTKN